MKTMSDGGPWVEVAPAAEAGQVLGVGDAPTQRASRRRWTTAFGWVAGVCLAVLLNYAIFAALGARPESYPVVPTTFAAVAGGGFGGMALADRLGDGGFRPLGIAAGLLLAVVLAFALIVLTG